MEHRYERRTQLVLPVEIWHRGHRVGRFRTRNLSRSGLCIETGAAGLRANDFVHLLLWTREGPCEVAGMVVHADGETLGVLCQSTLPDLRVLDHPVIPLPPAAGSRPAGPAPDRALA